MALSPGSTIDQYRIEALIGEGGFATVYKAYETKMDRHVAIKVLDDRLSRDRRFIERFKVEAEATFSLRHPHIVQVYDFKESDGRYYMVMEYIDGPSLRSIMLGKGALNLRESEEQATRLREQQDMEATLVRDENDQDAEATVLRQLTSRYQLLETGIVAQIAEHVCSALEYAHQKGIIHRDIKPDNILVASDGRALLSDFGIARIQEETSRTRTGLRIGTWAYMSPEQFTHPKEIDHRSDIYALGIVLYELLTGSVPFVGNDTQVLQMHLRERPLSLRTIRGDLSSELENIILRCLEKDPQARYATAREVSSAILKHTRTTPLTALFGKPGVATTPPPEPAGEPAAWVSCFQCGFVSPAAEPTLVCPACDTKLSVFDQRREVNRLEEEANKFINGFNLRTGLSLEVRAYEYEGRIEPRLMEVMRNMISEGEKILAQGSVTPPFAPAKELPEPTLALKAVRDFLNVASLWESQPLNDYVITLDAKRQRKKQLEEIRGRAYRLLGLYHSIRGAQGHTYPVKQAAYQKAQEWHQKSAQALTATNSEAAPYAQLSSELANLVLQFPETPEKPTPVPPQLPSPTRAAKDLATWNSYQGVYQRTCQKLSKLINDIQVAFTQLSEQLDQLKRQHVQLEEQAEQARQEHARRQANIKTLYAEELDAIQQKITRWRWFGNLAPVVVWLLAMLIGGTAFSESSFYAYLASLTLPLASMMLIYKTGRTTPVTKADFLLITYSLAGLYGLWNLINQVMGLGSSVLGVIAIPFLVGIYLVLGIQIFKNEYQWSDKNHNGEILIFWSAALVMFGGMFLYFMNNNYMFLNFCMLLMLVSGASAGYSYRKGVNKIQASDQEQTRELAAAQADFETEKARIANLINQNATTVREVTNRCIQQVDQIMSNIRDEADQLSARLLRKQSPQEIAGIMELEEELESLKQTLTDKPVKTAGESASAGEKLPQPATISTERLSKSVEQEKLVNLLANRAKSATSLPAGSSKYLEVQPEEIILPRAPGKTREVQIKLVTLTNQPVSGNLQIEPEVEWIALNQRQFSGNATIVAMVKLDRVGLAAVLIDSTYGQLRVPVVIVES